MKVRLTIIKQLPVNVVLELVDFFNGPDSERIIFEPLDAEVVRDNPKCQNDVIVLVYVARLGRKRAGFAVQRFGLAESNPDRLIGKNGAERNNGLRGKSAGSSVIQRGVIPKISVV